MLTPPPPQGDCTPSPPLYRVRFKLKREAYMVMITQKIICINSKICLQTKNKRFHLIISLEPFLSLDVNRATYSFTLNLNLKIYFFKQSKISLHKIFLLDNIHPCSCRENNNTNQLIEVYIHSFPGASNTYTHCKLYIFSEIYFTAVQL